MNIIKSKIFRFLVLFYIVGVVLGIISNFIGDIYVLDDSVISYFELFKGDKLLGRMHSMWSIVDIESRSIVPVPSAIPENPKMVPFQKREDDLSFAKIAPITNPSLEKEFEVRYNDLDVNGHANNGNYIVWAFEPLSFEFKNTHRIKTIDMIYKKEAKFGEKFVSQIEFKDENTTIHRLQNSEGEDLFLLECSWV